MLSFLLCILSLFTALITTRRSVVTGLGVVLTVGYAYGIARANIEQPGSHFTFDAAVVGLFLGRLTKADTFERPVPRMLILWCLALVAWPLLLIARPVQDPLVQLAGFRGAAFFLPFILIGSQLTDDERYALACWCASLNVVAFAFAVAEFSLGIRFFYPENAATFLIYSSHDVGKAQDYRIPATFATAHLFGGTMVLTLPLLLGAWMSKRVPPAHRTLLVLGMLGAAAGVFLSAARLNAVLLLIFVGFVSLATRMTLLGRAMWLVMVAGVAAVVLSMERLMRFSSLSDAGVLQTRIVGSVNSTILETALAYPMGNGLGGGGTSLPSFLLPRLTNGLFIENEYARLMLELGIPGLLLWLVFLIWALTQRVAEADHAWQTAKLLAWVVIAANLASGMIGTGMLTSIPTTALFLLYVGWMTQGSASEQDDPQMQLQSAT